MGIYIPDMEMPKSCDVCPHPTCTLWQSVNGGERNEKCPIIPVQPHGRLGDLDTLAGYIHQQEDWLSEAAIHAFCGILCKMPTIIPAEEGNSNVE